MKSIAYVPLSAAIAALKRGDTPLLAGSERAKGLKMIDAYGGIFKMANLYNMLGGIRGARENDLASAHAVRYLAASVDEDQRENFGRLLKERIRCVQDSGSKDKDAIISLLHDARRDLEYLDYRAPADERAGEVNAGATIERAIRQQGDTRRSHGAETA